MTAATTATLFEMASRVPHMGTVPSAANQLFYKNTNVAIDANGRAVVPSADDGLPVVGRATATFDNRTGSEAGGLDDSLDIEIEYGVVEMVCPDTVHEGDPVYSVDNQTVDSDSNSGARGLAGIVSEQRDGQTFVWTGPLTVYLDSLEKRMYALETAP